MSELEVIEPLDRIIWSADEPSMKALGSGIRRMDGLRVVKIDRLFMERRDPSIVARIHNDYGVLVFDDAKMIEIPTKLEALALTHLKYKPWMLNCMAGCVSSKNLDDPKKLDGLKRFADACHKYGTLPCAVTVLTSKADAVIAEEFGGNTGIDQVLWYVEILMMMGFTDVVCSPDEVPAIRAESRFNKLKLNTPGIVLSGADPQDQARTDTPAGALHAKSDRLVIGRALTEGDKAENFKRVAAEVKLALAV